MLTKILIDTDVWLDLASDYRLLPVLTALEVLTESDAVELIMPQVVLDEFARNRDRVVEQNRRSFASHIKRVREAVVEFGDEEKRDHTLEQLGAIEHKIAMKGEASRQTLERIRNAMISSAAIAASDDVKSRVIERAIAKLAPFHRGKNSVGDGLLLEIFADEVQSAKKGEIELFFVTRNTRDFSCHNGDRRLPHADLESIFEKKWCHYSTSIVDVIKRMDSEMLAEYEWEHHYQEEPRWLSEMLDAERLLFKQVWYNRHMHLRSQVEQGDVRLIANEEFKVLDGYHPEVMVDTVWKGAVRAAKRTEDEVGRENLGPWDDFEWGMINGKLSALRWVLGDDWDMLDT